jgi:tellurite resistance protein
LGWNLQTQQACFLKIKNVKRQHEMARNFLQAIVFVVLSVNTELTL